MMILVRAPLPPVLVNGKNTTSVFSNFTLFCASDSEAFAC